MLYFIYFGLVTLGLFHVKIGVWLGLNIVCVLGLRVWYVCLTVCLTLQMIGAARERFI